MISNEPDPATAVQLADVYELLFAQLPDESLRAVALMRGVGLSVAEIADRIGRSTSAVERKLRMIRELWKPELLSLEN